MNEMWNIDSMCNSDNQWYNGMSMGVPQQPRSRTISKQDILNFIRMNMQTQDIVQVETFENVVQRHICPMGKKIEVLKELVYPLQADVGRIINIKYFYCPKCRKCIVNKESIETIN